MSCKKSCSNESRREFLQTTGCGLFTLAALGIGADVILPVNAIAATGSGPEKVYPIPAADGVNIDRRSQIIIVRYANRMYAFSLACPHENAAVKWVAKDRKFACTKHDSEYTPDGKYTTGHATRNLDRFPVRKDGTTLVVTTDRVYHSDQNAAAWAAAGVDV
jgi:Rieske Fe-S protein